MLREAIGIDHWAINAVQALRINQIDTVFEVISWSVAIFIILGVFCLWKKKDRLNSFILFITSGLTFVIVSTIKLVISRWRPDMSEALSFPSLHAALAFLFAFYYPSKYKYWLVLWAFLVGFSRVWLNQHYFSDVLAGAVIGVAIAYFLKTKRVRAKTKALLNLLY